MTNVYYISNDPDVWGVETTEEATNFAEAMLEDIMVEYPEVEFDISPVLRNDSNELTDEIKSWIDQNYADYIK